jgi:arylsulfatase
MQRRFSRIRAIVTGWLVGVVLVGVRTGVAGALPNVVVIFCDDLGYGDIGAFGAKAWRTPNLDRMAAEGRKFSRFYVSSAVCSASRAALLTGSAHSRVGVHGAFGPGDRRGLAVEETTRAEVVRAKGYATAIFGKWHLGRPEGLLPVAQGFEEYFGLPYSGDMWPKHPETPKAYPPLPLMEGAKVLRTLDDQSDLTAEITARAVRFIGEKKDRPFLLYVPHPQPHVPLYCSERFLGKSGAGLYGDVIEELDWSVGEILGALRVNGLDERTLVVFTSDNGPWLSYGDHAGTTGGLREGKGTSWEGGIRVPCVMRWPGVIPAGSECREPVATIDLVPTVAALTGAELPAGRLDGVDVRAAMEGKGPVPERELCMRYADNELQAVIAGRWKLVLPHAYRTLGDQEKAKGGIPVKYRVAKVTAPELYDLENDPGEKRDVAAERPEEVARLLAAAERSRKELGDSLTGVKGEANRPVGVVK